MQSRWHPKLRRRQRRHDRVAFWRGLQESQSDFLLNSHCDDKIRSLRMQWFHVLSIDISEIGTLGDLDLDHENIETSWNWFCGLKLSCSSDSFLSQLSSIFDSSTAQLLKNALLPRKDFGYLSLKSLISWRHPNQLTLQILPMTQTMFSFQLALWHVFVLWSWPECTTLHKWLSDCARSCNEWHFVLVAFAKTWRLLESKKILNPPAPILSGGTLYIII